MLVYKEVKAEIIDRATHHSALYAVFSVLEFVITSHESSLLRPTSIVERIVRSLTFSALGLTHTCCEYEDYYTLGHYPLPMVWMKSIEEIEEIQAEERYLLEKLDSLVDEFMAKFSKQDVSLEKFLKNCWWNRICEIYQEEKNANVSGEERAAIQEVGVWIA